ncbi:MAG: hypothetical protein L3K26_06095 [Candidatus Hydrogenedentes bacterium]|nr:hypothetical protein [Candidatus Hydrogenedentota bacterium]
MDVKQAVKQAKMYVADLFADEKPSNLGLEEVEYEEGRGEWLITIGFSRPWESPKNRLAGLVDVVPSGRSYKVVCVSDETGKVQSVKNYETKH